MTPEDSEQHALVTEVRLLRAEFVYVKEALIQRNKAENEIFDRLREIESTIAVLHATKPTKANAWAIAAVIVSGMVALVTVIESVSLQ